MTEKRFCESCASILEGVPPEEEMEATIQCERCGRWLCETCYGTKQIRVGGTAGRWISPNSPRFSEPTEYDKPFCDDCMEDKENAG